MQLERSQRRLTEDICPLTGIQDLQVGARRFGAPVHLPVMTFGSQIQAAETTFLRRAAEDGGFPHMSHWEEISG